MEPVVINNFTILESHTFVPAAAYSQTKQEAELANARATDMWNQAKK